MKSVKEKECDPLDKEKILLVLLIIFFNTFFLFSQNYSKNLVSSKERNLASLDSLVNFNEEEGIWYYHHLKYDSAIMNFRKSKGLIDSLSIKRKKLSDYINSLVTSCNIGLSYSKLHKFGLALKQVPAEVIDYEKWYSLLENKVAFDQTVNEMTAFLEFTQGDCYEEMNRFDRTIQNFVEAFLNLKYINCGDPTTITYKYALKSYLYTFSYRDILKSFAFKNDTDNLNFYYNKLKYISNDR